MGRVDLTYNEAKGDDMITKKLLSDWRACWDDASIAGKLAGRESVTPREVAQDTSISADDRLWVLCRTLWYLDESAARGFAIDTALTVAHLAGDEDDQAQFHGLMNELLVIEDMPIEQRDAARDATRDAAAAAAAAARDAAAAAAWYAAWDSARDSARDSAWYAARDATSDAAWGAAWYAVRYAASDAAWDAARDSAIEASIARAIEWLGDYADGWEE